jgi:hypothetical protein
VRLVSAANLISEAFGLEEITVVDGDVDSDKDDVDADADADVDVDVDAMERKCQCMGRPLAGKSPWKEFDDADDADEEVMSRVVAVDATGNGIVDTAATEEDESEFVSRGV